MCLCWAAISSTALWAIIILLQCPSSWIMFLNGGWEGVPNQFFWPILAVPCYPSDPCWKMTYGGWIYDSVCQSQPDGTFRADRSHMNVRMSVFTSEWQTVHISQLSDRRTVMKYRERLDLRIHTHCKTLKTTQKSQSRYFVNTNSCFWIGFASNLNMLSTWKQPISNLYNEKVAVCTRFDLFQVFLHLLALLAI